eukprot:1832139-Prymnesium_polylepis.3
MGNAAFACLSAILACVLDKAYIDHSAMLILPYHMQRKERATGTRVGGGRGMFEIPLCMNPYNSCIHPATCTGRVGALRGRHTATTY